GKAVSGVEAAKAAQVGCQLLGNGPFEGISEQVVSDGENDLVDGVLHGADPAAGMFAEAGQVSVEFLVLLLHAAGLERISTRLGPEKIFHPAAAPQPLGALCGYLI